MSVNVGPSDADRYEWKGASDEALAGPSSRIARLLARSGMTSVGFLPVDDALGAPERLAPLVLRIAEALLGFTDKDVAVVDAWPTWPWGEAAEVGEGAAHRMRWVRPRVMEIAPTPCGDALAASVALENALAGRPKTLAFVLVNLAGYAAAGVVPVPVGLVDGVILLVAPRRTHRHAVISLARSIPSAKGLGVILVG